MIRHSYINASDDLAQYTADNLPSPRQEVTIDWYLENACDESFWRWTEDDDAEMGLDPWRYHMDLSIDPEDAKARGWRIFLQCNRIQPQIDEMLQDCADQKWTAQ